ncbi:MAG: hypothetical protein P9M11_10555 [Candidatus Tenebribacter burtonii]|nr:hypothetical protein [Candidatus Tenebribacter burtonii]
MNKVSFNTYQLYFSYSRSKNYDQCVELVSRLALKHETIYLGDTKYYEVTFSDDQTDLMALMFKLSFSIMYHNSLDIWKNHKIFYEKLNTAHNKVIKKLLEKGYTDPQNVTVFIKKIAEHIPEYIEIIGLIKEKNYQEAVNIYYDYLGDKPYGVLTPELIYLKHLGKMNLSGRDLLYYKPESSWSWIITENLNDYIVSVDDVIKEYKRNKLQLPLDIILDNAQTIEDFKNKLDHEIFIMDDKFYKNWPTSKISKNKFPIMFAPEGRFFERYIDQVKECNVFDWKNPETKIVWTKWSPEFYESNIIIKNYVLLSFPCYIEKFFEYNKKQQKFMKYKYVNSKKVYREMRFTRLTKIDEIEEIDCSGKNIEYTGQTHIIEGITFYEIRSISEYRKNDKCAGNPCLDLVDELLREAENILREKLNLPRIGEGWISEMKMFNLIKKYFPDAKHQARPVWLKPQHLDVFIPSKKIAFEYQGKQHYEPVDFFGGEESFKNMIRLDKRKRGKCKKNKVILVEWKYTENIDYDELINKLRNYDIELNCY